MAENSDNNTHVLQLDGEKGDLHCMECLLISNYLKGGYCCSKNQNLSIPEKNCGSAFLMVCLQRHAIGEMVKALLAGKQVVDKNGKCAFCRNKKQHEVDKWCSKKTVLELYLHRVDKEEVLVDKYLEKYLAIRLQNRLNDLTRVHQRIDREMRAAAVLQGKTKEETEAMMKKQGRDARRRHRREEEMMEAENNKIRERLAENLLSKRLETIKKIEDATVKPALSAVAQE